MLLELLSGYGTGEERFWKEMGFSKRTHSGKVVDVDTAMTFSAYSAAVTLIAGNAAKLPVHIFKRIGEEERKRVRDHHLEWMLNRKPNTLSDSLSFRETLQMDVVNHGNGYAEIVRAGSKPIELWHIPPSRVRIDVVGNSLVYIVRRPDNREDRLDASRVFHIRNISPDGIYGWSTIRLAQEAIGLGLAAESYGAEFFGNGSQPGGVLMHPGKLTEKAAENLRRSWQERHANASGKSHTTAVLQEGMQWQQTTTDHEKSQFLEIRKYQVTEIARWLRIPPHMLADLDRSTNNNIEQQSLEFVTYCLSYWLEKWEAAIDTQLLLESEQKELYSEVVTDALLKADIQSRYNAYSTALSNGWTCVNEVRRKENMRPIGPKGDIYLLPANMLKAEDVLEPPEPPAPAEPPAQEEEPQPNEPTPTARMKEIDEAFQKLWANTWDRHRRREVAEILKAAKKPGVFLQRVEDFYQKLEPMMVESLGPIALSWTLASPGSRVVDVPKYAKAYCDGGRQRLLALAGECTPDGLLSKVEEWFEQ